MKTVVFAAFLILYTSITYSQKEVKVSAFSATSTKYAVVQGNALYWVITPKVTLKDLAAIQEEVSKHGLKLTIAEMKLDPLHNYIESMDVLQKWDDKNYSYKVRRNDSHEPIASIGGAVYWVKDVDNTGIGTDTDGLVEPLKTVALIDEKEAKEVFESRKTDYLLSELKEKAGDGAGTSIIRMQGTNLKTKISKLVYLSENGTLRFGDDEKASIYYLNHNKVPFETIEKLAGTDVKEIIFYNVTLPNSIALSAQRYVLVFTK